MKKFGLSIKARFNIFLVIIIFAFLLIIIIYSISINKLQNLRNYSELINKFELEYLKLRKHEQKFLLTYKEDAVFFKTSEIVHLRMHKNTFTEIERTLQQIQKNHLTEKTEIIDKFSLISDYTVNYNRLFNLLVRKIYERGSNETGLIGELMNSVANAQKNCNNQILTNYVSQLRQLEKSYLLNKDIQNYNEFIKEFANLNQFINQINITKNALKNDTLLTDSAQYLNLKSNVSYLNQTFIKSMNAYKRYFVALVKIDKEIGYETNEGLQGDFNAELEHLEPELESVVTIIAKEKEKTIRNITLLLIYTAFIIIGLVILIIIRFSSQILKPLNKLKAYIEPLSKGILPEKTMDLYTNDELSMINDAINDLIVGLKKTTSFASTIGKGVFDTEFQPLSEKDVLGNSLLDMRKNLIQAQLDEETRKYEDSLRKWANEGLAKFAEIMRQSTRNIAELSSNVIKSLVGFLEANQGGLFLFNDNDKNDVHLELVAAYAYNQEKKRKKKIYLGEGLVGTCAVEKATIYMTDIPNDYLTITSGLGGSNPRSLLIIPLKVEDTILGIIELASFKKFEPHEIEFVEKVSESIASTLSIAKINQRTAELLEQSQKQAEEMASQEEEMRQNLEELQSTQEESARREAEMRSIIGAINNSSLLIEFDLNGKIIEANESVIELFGFSRDQLIGRYYGDFDIVKRTEEEIQKFWETLRDGQVITETHQVNITGKDIWLHEVYSPIIDPDGFPYKVVNLATDITAAKQKEIELKETAETMAAQEEELRQNLEELMSTQEQMTRQQQELELSNQKMAASEQILKKALQKAKEQELVLIETNEQLKNQEEELRRKMTELQETHAYSKQQQQKIEEANKQMKISDQQLRKALEDAKNREKEINDKNMQLASSEEELRQNMEELQATQEQLRTQQKELEEINKELAIREAEMKGRLYAINQTNLVAEFNIDGTLIRANNKFCELFGYLENDVVGRHHRTFLDSEYKKSNEYKDFWQKLRDGQFIEGEFKHITKNNDDVYLQAIFNPIFDDTKKPYKILLLAQDITDNIAQRALINSQLEAIDKTNILLEFELDGTITNANQSFCKTFNITKKDIIGKNHRIFLKPEYKSSEDYHDFWTELKNGHINNGEFELISNNDSVYIQGVYAPLLNISGKPHKIILLGFDITTRKLQEESIKLQAKEMAAQEEELRQNLEMMMQSQEEISKKQFFYEQQIQTLTKDKENELNKIQEIKTLIAQMQSQIANITIEKEKLSKTIAKSSEDKDKQIHKYQNLIDDIYVKYQNYINNIIKNIDE